MLKKTIKIGSRMIGENQPCFIIAEAGCNHDQNLDQAKRLIDAAALAQADAVKFQIFSAEKIAAQTKESIADMGRGETLYSFFKKLELPNQWIGELSSYAQERGIIFLCTPFDEAAVDFLDSLGLPAYKVASFELVHLPLIRYIALKGRPVILSTGMANLEEIREALEVCSAEGNEEIALLHCGINYPARFEDVNLAAMETMREAFNCLVGYSDHTPGITVPVAAAARGAKIIEKHFTIDKSLPGGEHYFSLDAEELKLMVQSIRECEKTIGSPVKDRVLSEELHYQRGRRSIFARVNIAKGTTITGEMLDILRPGIGLKPKHLEEIIGKRAKVDITRYEPIRWEILY